MSKYQFQDSSPHDHWQNGVDTLHATCKIDTVHPGAKSAFRADQKAKIEAERVFFSSYDHHEEMCVDIPETAGIGDCGYGAFNGVKTDARGE